MVDFVVVVGCSFVVTELVAVKFSISTVLDLKILKVDCWIYGT
jgi:hypothetical protein